MPDKITKRNMEYFQKKYSIDKLFANPSTAPASILHCWIVMKEMLEIQTEILALMKNRQENKSSGRPEDKGDEKTK